MRLARIAIPSPLVFSSIQPSLVLFLTSDSRAALVHSTGNDGSSSNVGGTSVSLKKNLSLSLTPGPSRLMKRRRVRNWSQEKPAGVEQAPNGSNPRNAVVSKANSSPGCARDHSSFMIMTQSCSQIAWHVVDKRSVASDHCFRHCCRQL